MGIEQVIIVFHVLIAFAIIALILLQQGKGAEMGASFGAGSSQTVFGGAGGGNVLTKATAILAASFFVTSFALAIVAKNNANQVVDFDIPVLEVVEEDEVPVVSGKAVPEEIPSDPESSDAEIPGIDD